MNKLFTIIFSFSIISILAFFFAVFIFQVGDELILTPINNIANETATDMGISDAMVNSMHDNLTNYREMNLPYDLFFIASFISVFALSIIAAYNSREQSYASFFGSITIGLIIFLVATGFIITIQEWIVLNLIQSVLSFDLNTTPIFNFYIEYLGFINFIWAFLLILINKLPFVLQREEDINDFSDDNGGFQQ